MCLLLAMCLLVLLLWIERNQEQSCFYYLFYGLQKYHCTCTKIGEDEDFFFLCMFSKHRMVSKFVYNAQSFYHLLRNNIEEKQRQTNSLWLYSQSCAQWAQFYLCFRAPGYHPCISRKLRMKQTELLVTYYSDVTFKIEAREAFQRSLW